MAVAGTHVPAAAFFPPGGYSVELTESGVRDALAIAACAWPGTQMRRRPGQRWNRRLSRYISRVEARVGEDAGEDFRIA